MIDDLLRSHLERLGASDVEAKARIDQTMRGSIKPDDDQFFDVVKITEPDGTQLTIYNGLLASAFEVMKSEQRPLLAAGKAGQQFADEVLRGI